jgi:hypothetical protein
MKSILGGTCKKNLPSQIEQKLGRMKGKDKLQMGLKGKPLI